MMKLEDLAPTSAELDLTTRKGMPEQAAIGYIEAVRNAANPFYRITDQHSNFNDLRLS